MKLQAYGNIVIYLFYRKILTIDNKSQQLESLQN